MLDPAQPPFDVRLGSNARMNHDLRCRSGVLQCVMVLERDAEVRRYVLETVTAASVSIRPRTTGNFGAVEPRNLKLFKVVPCHGPFERNTIE